MAQSGWYDDPDGTPGRLRYWDGTRWTWDTMPHPGAASPSPAPASTPPTLAPAAPGIARRRARLLPVLGVLAVLIGVVATVYAFTRPPAATPGAAPTQAGAAASPTVGAAAPTTAPTTAATTPTQPSTGSPAEQPGTGSCPSAPAGSLTDGTIGVTIPSTWQSDTASATWAECPMAAGRQIVDGWQTSALVATVSADGQGAQQVAQAVWTWNAQTNYESPDSSVRVTSDRVTAQQSTTVGGRKAFRLTGQVTIAGLSGVPGDDVSILVVENADGSHSVLLTTSTIGDAASKSEVAAIWASITVS